MKPDDYPQAGLQRLFQKGDNNFVLMHKTGKTVAFQLDQHGTTKIVDRQEDVDFRSTGLSLINDGWKCVGPGLEFSGLFDEQSALKKN